MYLQDIGRTVHYRTVYDVHSPWTPQWMLLFVVVLIGVGVQHHIRHSGLKYSVTSLLASVAITINGLDYWNTYRLRQALETKHYTSVEGIVRNFTPGDKGAHRSEVWEVESNSVVHHYQYRQSSYHPGFSQTFPYGGAIREGLQVRIADVNGTIARLEVSP